MTGRFWRRDSIARRFILTVVAVVVCTLGLVALFLSFGGIWAAPPIEKTGLMERAAEIYRIINAAPPSIRPPARRRHLRQVQGGLASGRLARRPDSGLGGLGHAGYQR